MKPLSVGDTVYVPRIAADLEEGLATVESGPWVEEDTVWLDVRMVISGHTQTVNETEIRR